MPDGANHSASKLLGFRQFPTLVSLYLMALAEKPRIKIVDTQKQTSGIKS